MSIEPKEGFYSFKEEPSKWYFYYCKKMIGPFKECDTDKLKLDNIKLFVDENLDKIPDSNFIITGEVKCR